MTWPMHPLDLSALLSQSDHWINIDGDRVPMSEIDARYARNILRLLQNNAPAWKSAVESIYLFSSGPSGEMAQDAFEAEFDQLMRTRPAIWMQSTRLYQAIQRRTAQEVPA